MEPTTFSSNSLLSKIFHVCEILEGGTEAFKKRENKYAIGDAK
jgi:hypothetical protein